MMVLDASTAVNALIPGALRAVSLRAIGSEDFAAPALIDSEVASALARLERARRLTGAEADAALTVWADLDVERVDLPQLLPQAWGLRHRIQLTDAFYVVLARALECPLLTCDGKLARAGIPGLVVRLIV
jgi:predicted nucleic acid-binding protein